MIDLRRKRRALFKPMLNWIRFILNKVKEHAYPTFRNLPKNSYDLYLKEELINCYQHFKQVFKKTIFLETKKIREYAIKRAIENDPDLKRYYIEFGVYSGSSINYFSNILKNKEIYGFDSFEGLREDWLGTATSKGTFNLNKRLPKLNTNVIPIVGWVQDVLSPFLEKHKPEINFVHMDMDTYETTKFILTNIKPYISKNCIILFDEFYNFPGWDVGEYKALKEVFKDNEYKFLSFAKDGNQTTIQIL
jgi:hypothetical protein